MKTFSLWSRTRTIRTSSSGRLFVKWHQKRPKCKQRTSKPFWDDWCNKCNRNSHQRSASPGRSMGRRRLQRPPSLASTRRQRERPFAECPSRNRSIVVHHQPFRTKCVILSGSLSLTSYQHSFVQAGIGGTSEGVLANFFNSLLKKSSTSSNPASLLPSSGNQFKFLFVEVNVDANSASIQIGSVFHRVEPRLLEAITPLPLLLLTS